jgi:2-aminoadipate transaminase
VQAKQGSDLHTPTLNQMIVAELVDDVLPRQVERVRHVYGERALRMIDRIGAEFPDSIRHTTPEGGMFLWLTLPEGVDTTRMLPHAVELGVAYVPGAPFFALGGGDNTMRLSYSCATTDQIDRGIAALGTTIRDALR